VDGEGTVCSGDEAEASDEGDDFVDAVVVIAGKFVEGRNVLL